MNKLIKKTTATLLIAAFMISMFTVAMVSADQYIVLDSTDAYYAGAEATTDGFVLGTGSWKVYPELYPNDDVEDDKMQIYLGPEQLGLEPFTIDQISSISFYTNKPVVTADFYLAIYTEQDGNDDGSWYGYRLNGEPYYSLGLVDTVDVWNEWNTDNDGANQLTFFDTAKTAGGYGFYIQPTLQELQAGTINWHDYNEAYTDQNIDYGLETVMCISFQTGTGTAPTLTSYLDAIEVVLTDGSSAIIDLEAGEVAGVSMTMTATVPKIGITIDPTSVNFGEVVLGKESDPKTIWITSTSETSIKVTASLFDPDDFYAECLKIDGGAYDEWSLELAELAFSDVELKLVVPRTQSPGTHEGTLVFWAEEYTP